MNYQDVDLPKTKHYRKWLILVKQTTRNQDLYVPLLQHSLYKYIHYIHTPFLVPSHHCHSYLDLWFQCKQGCLQTSKTLIGLEAKLIEARCVQQARYIQINKSAELTLGSKVQTCDLFYLSIMNGISLPKRNNSTIQQVRLQHGCS